MNSSTTPRLLSPGSSTQNADSLLASSATDIQDIKSSQSDQHQMIVSPGATTTGHHLEDHRKDNAAHHDNQMRSSVKTEYKSNFTPFDQYVYNEITDSFVKQPHQRNTVSNNLLIESRNNPISASSSSQDLAAQSEAHAQHATSAVSPALEAGVFEPVNGSDANHQHDVTSEPWYMEVMKRNEKAHEYRYKSELGHNSALLNDSSIDKDLIRKSPLGNDPLIEAQILDKQQQLNSSNRTGTHEYKRDHMISHMANNNNFKLPKDPGTNSSGAPASRRVIVGGAASSSRPLSRTTAASRARSQSSKRPVTTTTTLAKNESTTKSNQTTPTKSVPSRVSATARPKATAPVAKTTSSTLSNGSGRPATASTRRPLTASTTSRVMPPKTATTAASNARTTTPVSSTRSTGLKPYGPTAAKTVPRTVPASSTTQTASKSPIKRATNTTSMSNRPSTAASRPTTTRYSGNASSAKTTKQAASGPTATSAIKSIKTKALVDAGEKTAALQANSSSNSDAGSDQKQLVPETNVSMTTKEVETQQPGSNEINVFAPATIENFDPGNPEPDLIFSTTEAGNMLADEIAQAEKFANETTIRERFEYARKASNATDPENLEAEVTSQSARDSREMVEPLHAEPTPVLESSELVNGLAGGLVSAEDRYEASEHDASLDYGAQQSGQSYAHGEQGYDHEPYSIMPTTYGDENKKNEQLPSEPTVRDASDETIIKNLDASSDESVSPSQTEKADNQMESERLNAPSDAMSKFDDDLMSSNTDGAAGNEDHNADATNEIVDNNMRNHEHTDLEILDSSKSVEHLEGDKHASEHHPDDANDDTSSAGVSTPPHPPSPAPTPLHELSTPSESEKTVFKDDQIGLMERVSSVNALDEVTNNVPDELTAMGHDLPQIATSDHTDSSNPPKQATSAVIDHESDTLATHAEQPVSETLEDTDNDHINDIVEKLEPLNFDDDLDFPGLADREDGQSVVDHEDRKEESQSHEQLTQIHRQSIVDQTETGSQTNEEIQDLEGSNMRQQASVEDQSSMDQYDGSAATCNVDNKPIDSPESKADSDYEVVVNKNELLMNVSELEAFESMKRQEMSRKSELAREQSNSSTSLTPQHASELLLSVDQLDERFAQIPTTGDTNSKQGQQEDHHNKDIVPLDDPTEIDHHVESGTLDLSHNIVGLDNLGSRNSIDATKPENSGETVVVRPDTDLDTKSSSDLLNFGSITPTNDQLLDTESRVAGTEWTLEMSKDQKAEEKYTGSKTFDIVEVTNQESSQEGAQQKPLRRESSSEPDDNMDMYQAKHEDSVANLDTNSNQATKSTTSINDDEMDEEEQLKLSNHLTNSDDDVILEPRNRKEDSFSEDAFSPHRAVSPSRYNEGAGLGMMAQEDEVGTVELADGSSAEIVAPTVAENRVEVSTSKSMMPEISQAATFIHPLKLTQEDDEYDENEDWNLNPSADPIDVAATMSPSSSVAEEMLRLSRQASLSNALAELNVSRTTGSPSEPSGIDLNETENADSTRQAGVEFARVAEIMRQGSKDDDANLLRSNSSSSSSLSSKEGHQSTHATDKAGSKTDLLVGGPELGPINNNDIDNVDNRKQNIDINSDRNSGNVKQADEMHVQGSQTTGLAAVVAAATDKADQMVAEDQAKDADVTLSSK